MPNTVNRALTIPNTGDLPGAWGTAALNPNFQVLDGILAGVVSVALTNVNVSLTISTGVIGTGSITPGAGPVQADNAVIKFSGTLTGNCVITFPCPGYWIVENNCTVGAFYVQSRANGTGNLLGLPPGEPTHVYNDGTDCKFVNMGRVGSYMDLAVTTTPAWMTACSVLPYLPCNSATTYTTSIYPILGGMLGSTFGGNGVSTFGVPDLSNRARVSLGTRITTAVAGFDGNTFGAAGGSQNPQQHTHTNILTDPGHTHPVTQNAWGNSGGQAADGSAFNSGFATITVNSATTNITLTNASSGSGSSGNIQPTLVAGITFIKT